MTCIKAKLAYTSLKRGNSLENNCLKCFHAGLTVDLLKSKNLRFRKGLCNSVPHEVDFIRNIKFSLDRKKMHGVFIKIIKLW